MGAIAPRSGRTYADVTVGAGGHSRAILELSAPDGRVVAFDRDAEALARAKNNLSEFGDRVTFVHARFGTLVQGLDAQGVGQVDGLVADLGVSSPQLDSPERGFSFATEGPIDMRMDPSEGQTALELIASVSEEALANILFELGEERRSRRIARSIQRAHTEGRLNTTRDLRAAVVRAVGPKRGRRDPATRTFQALRIAVNGELDELKSLLKALPTVITVGGVAAVISFHSLEDRLVKRAFIDDPALEPITKRPMVASDQEQRDNRRSRSAKLRAARRVQVQA